MEIQASNHTSSVILMRTLAGFILLLALTMPASAQWHGGHGGWGHPHGGFHSGAFGGGLGGFFGGIVGGTIGSFLRPQEPSMPVPEAYALRPGSPEWYAYCARRYQSFSPVDGTYLGYDGFRHACQ